MKNRSIHRWSTGWNAFKKRWLCTLSAFRLLHYCISDYCMGHDNV